MNQAKPEEWQAVILGANIELYEFNFRDTVDFFEKLEVRQALEKKRTKSDANPGSTNENRMTKTSGKQYDKTVTSKQRTQSKYTKCTHCGRTNHTAKDCWFNPENKGKTKPLTKKFATYDKQTMMMTDEQFNAILERLPRNPKSGKRKVRDFSPMSSDAEIVNMFGPKATVSKVDAKDTSDESSIYFELFSSEISSSKVENSGKKQKQNHKTTEVVADVMGTGRHGVVRVLLDTGASATIILRDAIPGLTGPVFKEQETKWHTMGGHFVTKFKREMSFTLPEFSTSKIITWVCHVDTNTLRKNAQYDMIIGADLLSELGIDINYTTQRIVWEGIEIPMKDKNIISEMKNAKAIYYQSIEPSILKEAEARQKRILDADYSAIDLDSYTHELKHLTTKQQNQLLDTLRRFPKTVKGGLGVLKVPPVHLELRPMDKHEKPYHARPFPIPKCYEETTKKEK